MEVEQIMVMQISHHPFKGGGFRCEQLVFRIMKGQIWFRSKEKILINLGEELTQVFLISL